MTFNGYRTISQHLNDLKKENFSLKLRIYFLEEKIQSKFEDGSSEDVHRKNIELKVEVESLKQELLGKHQLDKILQIETPAHPDVPDLQHHCEERQQISHIQEVLENKIQEVNVAQSEADKMASLAASESQHCVDLENRMTGTGNKHTQEEMLAEKDRRVQTLTEDLLSKDEEVMSLQEEKDSLAHKVTQLEKELQVKSEKEMDVKKLREEQQVQVVQCDHTASQCVTELQKAQRQLQSLQAKITERDVTNKELQQQLIVLECDLLSLRETAQGQERTIQTLYDALSTKDSDIADLQRFGEEQEQLLISLQQQNQKEQLQKLQASTTGPSPVQVELLELQASLFLTQLELQSVQRAQHHVQRREEEVVRANQRLLTKIQEEQHHYQEAKKHNQELLAALQRAHSDLEQMEERWKEGEADQESKVEERERTIRELKNKLQHKEHLLHDYTELLDEQKETGGDRDVLIHKLKLRIQNRDRALECAVDEKFVCVEQKVAEVHRLQLLIREKERDLQKLRCVLSNNEETITSLEMLVRGKSVELEQVSEAWRGSQQVQRECEDRHNCSMKERDTLINQLQTSLHMCTKQLEDLTAALVSDVPQSSGEVMEKLRAQLQVKERLFQELLAEHNRQTQEHHKQLQELLYAIHTREQCIKESAERVGQVMSEQAARVQELRRQMVSAGRKSVSTSEPSEDARVLREELQLVLSKEREAQRELTMLRSTLTNREEQLQVQNAQQHTLNYTSKPVQSASMGTEQTVRSHTHTGDCTVDVEEEEDGGSSAFVERTEEAEHCRVTAQVLFSTQDYDPHEDPLTCQSPTGLEGQGLAEVGLLLEQKQAVEHELWELKAQLQRTGFTSFSQMRKAFLSLRLENEVLRDSVSVNEAERAQRGREVQWQPKPCEGKTRCSRTLYLDPEAQVPHNTQLIWPKLQDKLPVSKICRQAETGRRGDHREQLIDSPVQPYRKQVQVDLQDLGYETCGRSENEAERDDTSSPEFDDLELCTSLSYRDDDCRWWTGPFAAWRAGGDVASLQQVEDLQVEFSRSQAQVLHLQDQPVDATPKSTLQKSNWDDGEMQELETRVSSLEEKLKKRKVHAEQETRSPPRTGEFDALIQAQARELSHLRQRMREGRSVCHILTQHLGDTTKSFEELLRDNDIDYYMGQNFRDQLAQSTTLALRVRAKISSRDYSEIPDDKTDHELLAIRFSKELKEKNKLIESLSTKLEQLQQLADAPTRNQLPAGGAEQFERAPLVMDEQGSTNKDLDLCSELDTISKFGQEEVTDDSLQPVPSHPLPSNPSTIKSSHSHRSSTCCSSMHCTPHRLIDGQIHTDLNSVPLAQSSHCLSAQMALTPLDTQKQHPRPHSSTTGGFSLAEVQQELQRLQRQLANSLSGAHVKPVTGVCFPTNSSDFHFKRSAFASLHANPNITYGAQQNRESAYNDSSSSSSGYHSSAHHTSTNPVGSPGTNLMEEHLREIRSLHRCLEESIQTNEYLRHQLAEKLDSKIQDGGAPTNIYIQGLDSISQLSSEVRALKEENKTLQHELQASRDGVKQVEELRDAVLLERSRLEQAELEAEKWAGQFRQLQAQLQEHTQAVLQLKQDKQNSQEHANRLQHEVNVLQQQLSESRRLVHELQAQIELQQKWSSITLQSGEEVQELPSHIHTFEQQLSDRLDSDVLHSSTGKHFFPDSPCPPPVCGAGLFQPAMPVSIPLHSSVPGYQERKLSDGSIICRTGCHVVGHWEDFSALQQHLSEGKVLICSVEAALQFSMRSNLHEGCINNVLSNTKTLKQILEETSRIIKTFWRADLPHTETATALCQQEQTLRDEVVFLRHKLVDREQNLRAMFETLRNSNRTKDSMEQFIVSQLSRTHDLLRTARMNLEKNELRIQSLSCSFSPPSPLSFSLTPPWLIRGEISNTGYSSSSQHSVLTSLDHKPAKRVSWEMPHPLQMLSVNARSTLHTSAPTPC